MEFLFDSFKKINRSYYEIPVRIENLLGNNNTLACRKFIEEHFKKGNKLESLNFDFYEDYYTNINNKDAIRHIHMVSLYFLGLCLQELFERQIKNALKKIISNAGDWYNFKYTWFLTCLYHDTASFIEKQALCYSNEKEKELTFWLGNENIKYTIYNHIPMEKDIQLTRFSEDLIKNYFYYRMDNGAKDHGIVSGYLLFDKLKKNFLKMTQGKSFVHGKEIIDNLNWRKEHLDHFAYIADAIVCHNLWTVSVQEREKADIYKKYELSPLILSSNDQRLNIQDYPIQFMLCLLDTIEPVKRFKNELSAKEVLDNISITANKNENQIIIAWTDEVESKKGYCAWQESIATLKDWMNIEISSCQEKSGKYYLIIEINQNKKVICNRRNIGGK